MSTYSLNGSTASSSLASLFAPGGSTVKRADRDADDRSGAPIPSQSSSTQGGGSLFSALYQALTQFVANNQAASSAGGASQAAGATGSNAAGSATSSAGSASSSASGGSLAQDLHSFLHDLFSALRQAGGDASQASSGAAATQPAPVATTPALPTPSATTPPPVATTPVTTTPVTTTPITTTPVTTPPATPAPVAATPPASSSTGSGATAANPAPAAGYGQNDIINALKSLIAALANNQEVGNGAGASGNSSSLSAKTLADLNVAFRKLISDLGGTTSATGSGSAPASIVGTATAPSSGSASTAAKGSAATTTAQPATAALQSFLVSFLQDLQSGGNTPGPLGNAVNATA